MIHDSLKNTEKIEKLHPLFHKAFAYIRSADFSAIEDGRYELEGDKLFVSIVTINGKEAADAVLETHNKYIDIQLPLSAAESIGWKAGSELKDKTAPYDAEKDLTFFHDKPTSYTKIQPGEFAVYFPEDGHAPGIGQGSIRKMIVKVQV